MNDKENYPNQLRRIIEATSLSYVLDQLHLFCWEKLEEFTTIRPNEKIANAYKNDIRELLNLKIEN